MTLGLLVDPAFDVYVFKAASLSWVENGIVNSGNILPNILIKKVANKMTFFINKATSIFKISSCPCEFDDDTGRL